MNDVIKIGNAGEDRGNYVTTGNLKYCLLSKGIIFNTHHHWFERNQYLYKGLLTDISEELCNDAIMFSLFYKGNFFTNHPRLDFKEDNVKNDKEKSQSKVPDKNYIMPYTARDLGCITGDLNVILPKIDEKGNVIDRNNFDFREWFKQFDFSIEANNLFYAALNIFKLYHKNFKNHDWNDSFYDITNAIMGKDTSQFSTMKSTEKFRIYLTKTTKGTKGFGRNTIKSVVDEQDLPMFMEFFDARDVLAKKINQQLLDAGILLWKRENIY